MRKEVISEVLLMNVEEAALSAPQKAVPFPAHISFSLHLCQYLLSFAFWRIVILTRVR